MKNKLIKLLGGYTKDEWEQGEQALDDVAERLFLLQVKHERSWQKRNEKGQFTK